MTSTQQPQQRRFYRLNDREAVDSFLRAVRGGVNVRSAARAARIREPQIYEWLTEARKPESEVTDATFHGLCVAFAEDVEDAKAQAIGTLEARIRIAADRDWRAGHALLKRLDPEGWGSKVAVEHSGAVHVDTPAHSPNMSDVATAASIWQARANMGDAAALAWVNGGEYTVDAMHRIQAQLTLGLTDDHDYSCPPEALLSQPLELSA